MTCFRSFQNVALEWFISFLTGACKSLFFAEIFRSSSGNSIKTYWNSIHSVH